VSGPARGDGSAGPSMFRDQVTRRRRLAVAAAGAAVLLLAALLLLTRCGKATSGAGHTIVGERDVTYGAPAVVTITNSGAKYTMIAKTPVRVTGASCDLPTSTVIATFSPSGTESFSGQHGLWLTANCAFVRWEVVTFTLSATGQLHEVIGQNLETHDLTPHRG
jgi:hypothetical protein